MIGILRSWWIGIHLSRWTPRFLSWSFQVLFGPSKYWIKSSICDNLEHQKRCSEILFFLRVYRWYVSYWSFANDIDSKSQWIMHITLPPLSVSMWNVSGPLWLPSSYSLCIFFFFHFAHIHTNTAVHRLLSFFNFSLLFYAPRFIVTGDCLTTQYFVQMFLQTSY